VKPRAGVMTVGAANGSRPVTVGFDAADQDPVEIYEAFERMLAAWPDARVPLKQGERDPGAVCGCGAVHGGWVCSHCTATPLVPERAAILHRIGNILRGDWSMTEFDGRDCKHWIDTALDGGADALKDLGEELRRIEDGE
jgi:hypothetical protein